MGLALRFLLPSRVRSRLRGCVVALPHGAVLAVASLVPLSAAQAQGFTWGGTGSTTATTGYQLDTNWSNPPAGAPPVSAGQSAVFGATGSSSVVSGFVSPNSWTFNAASQSYTISGDDVTFSLAGASGGIINNANAGQTISISNNIGGTVAGVRLQQLGSSTLVLTGTNTYTGGTTISAGTLQLGNGGTTGAIAGDVVNNGQLVFARSNTVTFGGTISGTGSVTIQNGIGGFTLLTGNSNYTGGTTISSGILVIGSGGTTGSIVGDIVNNSQLTFSRSDNVTFDGQITGSGALSKFGAGTLTLTADNTYSNGTVIAAGTLQLGNGGTTGNIGSSTLNDGGTLAFNRSNLLSFGAMIFGTGNVVQSGSGTTVLTAANSYQGGTTISAGTLQVTNNSSVGSGAVTLDGGTFRSGAANLSFANDFVVNAAGGVISNGNRRLTLSGVISDGIGAPAQLNLIGGNNGTTILSGVNTYSGGTLVSKTTVQVRNNSAVGTGTVTLNQAQFQAGAANLNISNSFAINDTPAGSAIDNNNRVLTLSGNITDGNGPGMLTFGNSGTAGRTILTGTNTYTGGTDICNCATVQLGDVTHTASIVGRIRNDGEFRILNADTTGITRIVNNGLTGFFNTTSASTATIVNNGLIGFADHSTAGNATIRNISGGIQFVNHSTAGDAIIVNRAGGLISFADNSTAGDATITTRQFAETFFDDHSNGGNARFITNGTGIVDFSGTTGAGGLHQITAGSIEGSGSYYIGAFNTLAVGGNNLSTEVSGVIADFLCGCVPGPGSLEKVGSGTLTLSGTNTYTGFTGVNGGTLLVTGSIASSFSVTVDNGATLGGTGTVPLTGLANGATLAPGLPTALGTLTVNDGLSFCNCTFYDVKVTSGGNDLTQVVAGFLFPGLANLAGTVRVTSLDNTYRFNSPYTILTAQGGFDLGGGPTRFNSLITPTGISGSLSYTATDVNLTLLSALGRLPGLNTNQHNVANVLDAAFNGSGSFGGLGAIFSGNIPQNLSQVSGENATGTQQATFDAMNLFMGLLTDPFIAGRGDGFGGTAGATPFAAEGEGASAYAAKQPNAARDAFAKFPTKADLARNDTFDQRWSVWGAAYGGGSTTDGNAALGSNTATARAFGLVAGADYRISPYTLAGFALAGGGTSFGVNGFGSGRSDLFQAGAFMRHTIGPAYVTAALAYGWQDVTTDRTVTVAGVDRLRAEFNANAWSGRVEGGYRFVTPWMGITPYAAGQFTTYSLPAYAEQVLSGASTFALNYAAKDVTASRSELGVRTDKSFAMQNGIVTLRGRAAWAHNFNIDRSITPVFQTLPGASFIVNGAAQARDAALVTGSAEMKWLNGFSLAATFEGEFSDVTKSYAGKGVARYAW
jgi:autotransporter-associated beta strand protein